MNDVIRYEKFKKVKDINDWLASGKLEEVFSNPDLKKKAYKILKDNSELHNSKESFSSMISQYAIQSIYNKFREKFDNEPNEVKKKELWRQELQSSNDYDPKYKRMLKQLGDIPGWNSRSTGYKSSSLSKDDWKRKGANSEYSPDEVMSLFQNNKITSEQYMSYQTGYRYRKKEYGALDNNFNNLIKSEFGISMKPPSGKNLSFLEFMPKNQDETELKNFILSRKASVMQQGLKADEYAKAMQDIIVSAKQKKIELSQRSQSVYNGQTQKDKLTSMYGTK
jgi:hypothetical protein